MSRKEIPRLCAMVVLFGFTVIGIVLFTNHWGMAIKVTNYLYFLLLGLVIYEKVT